MGACLCVLVARLFLIQGGFSGVINSLVFVCFNIGLFAAEAEVKSESNSCVFGFGS